jgi:cytochrome d ubiquinol oxidase subunit II
MSHDVLVIIWFVLLGVLLAGYAVLDGFDLGVGMLHPFVAKSDRERRLVMNSIGPLWDGNEVWLVTFGGAMFAMFPEAYATIFSGFYNAFMLLLLALIFRAVSMEFRSKLESPAWRRFWDWGFFSGSGLATLLFGVAVGNAMRGIRLDERHEYVGGFLEQLHPYNLVVGLLAVSMFVMHGSIFLYLKTEGDLQKRLVPVMWRSFFVFAAMFVLTTVLTLILAPASREAIAAHPWLAVVPLLNILAILNIPRAIHQRRPAYAFVSSSCSILAFVFLLGAALYPNIVPSNPAPENTLTIFQAASSAKTLTIGLIIVVIGMPLVTAYTLGIYWAFRGKVTLGETSY